MSFFTLPLPGSFGAYLALGLLACAGGVLTWRHRAALRAGLGPLAEIPPAVLAPPAILLVVVLGLLMARPEVQAQVAFLLGLVQVGLRALWGRLAVRGVLPVLAWIPYRGSAWPPWFPGGWVVVLLALALLPPAVLLLLLAGLGLRRWRWLREAPDRAWLLGPVGFLLLLSFCAPSLGDVETWLGNVTGALGAAYGVIEQRPRTEREARARIA